MIDRHRQTRLNKAWRALWWLATEPPTEETPEIVAWWIAECELLTRWRIRNDGGVIHLRSTDGREWADLDLAGLARVLEREWDW